MAMGLDVEAAAFEQNMYQALLFRANAARELVEAQRHLVKAREFESRAARILVRKAIYKEEIARLVARSKLFEVRAEECERYYKEENVEAFKNAALSRSIRSKNLIRHARMLENKISIIEEKVNDILRHADEQRDLREEHASEARRLEEEAVNVQRQGG